MTDKEIVERAKEAEKRTSFGELVHSPLSKGVNSSYGIGFIEGMVEYRNSLPEEPEFTIDKDVSQMADDFAEREYELDGYERKWLSKGYYHGYMDANKSKPEEPVSEELEEAAKDYFEHAPKDQVHLITEAFKAGAKWQMKQGWKTVDSINHPKADKKKMHCVFTKGHYQLATVINHPNDDELLQWKCTEFPHNRYDMCEGDRYMEIKPIKED